MHFNKYSQFFFLSPFNQLPLLHSTLTQLREDGRNWAPQTEGDNRKIRLRKYGNWDPDNEFDLNYWCYLNYYILQLSLICLIWFVCVVSLDMEPLVHSHHYTFHSGVIGSLVCQVYGIPTQNTVLILKLLSKICLGILTHCHGIHIRELGILAFDDLIIRSQ